jgi:hypothetical protein
MSAFLIDTNVVSEFIRLGRRVKWRTRVRATNGLTWEAERAISCPADDLRLDDVAVLARTLSGERSRRDAIRRTFSI